MRDLAGQAGSLMTGEASPCESHLPAGRRRQQSTAHTLQR
jgi:hypothetical protein